MPENTNTRASNPTTSLLQVMDQSDKWPIELRYRACYCRVVSAWLVLTSAMSSKHYFKKTVSCTLNVQHVTNIFELV